MGNYLSQSTADKSSISLLFWRFGVLAFWRFGVLALKNAGRGRKTVERIKWGGTYLEILRFLRFWQKCWKGLKNC